MPASTAESEVVGRLDFGYRLEQSVLSVFKKPWKFHSDSREEIHHGAVEIRGWIHAGDEHDTRFAEVVSRAFQGSRGREEFLRVGSNRKSKGKYGGTDAFRIFLCARGRRKERDIKAALWAMGYEL
ncbi:hypothetical protein HYFRA_00005075 [Hymenoscyphus fraxineus]|uniref:Uncharacterized protein n=1 Tax=Hymenoscyphus fraxineus TaxID=746836 RepID=A0A9N9PER3_9HELO|nr:hypothetical protein HYFRA_00005075 [Hymenoscyphus fraxineus]